MANAQSQPENKNFLSPLGFRFVMQRAPNVIYFSQACTLPSITFGQVDRETPLLRYPIPGDRLTYEPFILRFKVDEDMKNYLEILNWLEGLGHPEDLDQHRKLADRRSTSPAQTVVSDGTLIILTSNMNANRQVFFEDMFPINCTPLEFDSTGMDVEHLEATVTFGYRSFKIE